MSISVGVGLSTEKDPILAAKEAVRMANLNIHNKRADLAICFSSVDLASSILIKTINISLGEHIPIIGCSGAAIICNQDICKHGVVVMLLNLPEGVHFNTACTKELAAKSSQGAGEELGQKLLYGFKGVRRDLSIMFCDGLIQEGSNLIHGLQEKLGRSFPLVGGSASDNLKFQKTYLYFNQEIFSDGACAILFGGKLNFGLGVKHGWKPLGKPRYVTKCSGNIVRAIDNTPAAQVYEEYFACNLTELRKKLKYISVLYPIGIYLPGEEEYLLRNLISIENDGSLVFQGNVPENSLIRLMIGTKESCLTATRQATDEAKKSGANNFVLVFDSISRYILLRREANRELKIIKEGVGKDTPVIGLYTYGEQAPLEAISYHGQTYFHNQTIVILTVGA